jgi:hypothetical protein
LGRPKLWSPVNYWRYQPYECHPDGRIRNGKNELAVRFEKSGLKYVRLKLNATRTTPDVHPAHIVAITYLDRPAPVIDVDTEPVACPRPEGYRLIHRNGDPDDWRAGNLAWVEDSDWWFEFYDALMRQPPGSRLRRGLRRPPRVFG